MTTRSGLVARKGEAAVDAWTWVHLASGLALGLLGIPLWLGAVAIVGYEVLEAGLRRIKNEEGGLFEYESWPNILVDMLIGLGGFSVVRLLLPGFGVFA